MYSYEIWLTIAGGTMQLLCTLESPDAVGACLSCLCAVSKPTYASIEVRIIPKV